MAGVVEYNADHQTRLAYYMSVKNQSEDLAETINAAAWFTRTQNCVYCTENFDSLNNYCNWECNFHPCGFNFRKPGRNGHPPNTYDCCGMGGSHTGCTATDHKAHGEVRNVDGRNAMNVTAFIVMNTIFGSDNLVHSVSDDGATYYIHRANSAHVTQRLQNGFVALF